MISRKFFIKNRFGEKLEAVKEYKEGKERYSTVLLVPGLAMDVHEWGGSFDQISRHLVNSGFLAFRFSFAGCGRSEGDFRQMTIARQAKQVKDVIDFISRDPLVNKKRIGVLAQSMGGPSVIKALPLKISSLVLLSAVFNPGKSLKKVLIGRNVIFDHNGVIKVPRTNGSVTELGPQIWDDFQMLDLKNQLEKHAPFPVLVLHGTLDTKVSTKDAKQLYLYVQGGKEIVIYPQGDHGLEQVSPKLRQRVLGKIVNWFQKTL